MEFFIFWIIVVFLGGLFSAFGGNGKIYSKKDLPLTLEDEVQIVQQTIDEEELELYLESFNLEIEDVTRFRFRFTLTIETKDEEEI